MPRNPTPPARRPMSAADRDAAERALMLAADDPTNIPGIYNYCDRWCERCSFTGRCLSYKMGEARIKRKAMSPTRHSDQENAEFWDDIAESFALTLRMLRREAKLQGIDLDSPTELDKAAHDERRSQRRAAREGSALHTLATAYLDAAKTVLNRLTPEIQEVEETLNLQLQLGAAAPHSIAAEIRDALEVVQWYLFFIDAKLQRAVASRVGSRREGDDGFPSDSDGSAKIALVAIDRSLAAWARLRAYLTGELDAILDLLVQLERLRQAVEHEFPRARGFKRPGLD